MQFQIPIQIPPVQPGIGYKDQLMLTGSCFTEHIGQLLATAKFRIMQNPNGILFDPVSVCRSLIGYMEGKVYQHEDLFYLNEAWHCWDYHTRFSHPDPDQVLAGINRSQAAASQYLKNCNWLVITLGSAFSYNLTTDGRTVANCHKAPAQTFHKHMNSIEEIVTAFDGMLYRLFRFNPDIRVLFTISPVRHIRDGIVDNNRSKARLLEAVHHLVDKFSGLYYFPAYEIVVDVLRDYRFYDIDLVHPNYAATHYVLDKFAATYMDELTRGLMEQIRKLVIARSHKPFNPGSNQHQKFLQKNLEQTVLLSKTYPHIDFSAEIAYFGDQPAV